MAEEVDKDPDLKDPTTAFVLGLLLGPAGLVYVDIMAGCGMFVVGIIAGAVARPTFYSPFSRGVSSALIVTVIIHGICALIASSLCRSANDAIKKRKERLIAKSGIQALWKYQQDFSEAGTIITVTDSPLADGRRAMIAELDSGMGVKVAVCGYGNRIMSITSPDRNGETANYCLGLDDPAAYENAGTPCGAILDFAAGNGRYSPETQTLHKQLWEGETADERVTFRHTVPDSGLALAVTYRLRGTKLRVEYEATAASPCRVSLTHALCFGLPTERDSIYDDVLLIPATASMAGTDSEYKPFGDDNSIDFRKPVEVTRERVKESGITRYFLFDQADKALETRARMASTGRDAREVRIFSTDTGFWLCGGKELDKALVLTDALENSTLLLAPIHPAATPLPQLNPGETYRKTVVYEIGVATWKPYVQKRLSIQLDSQKNIEEVRKFSNSY